MARTANPPQPDAEPVLPEAGTVPSRRHEGQTVVRDRRLELPGATLASRLSALGIHSTGFLLALEACVGGVSFGEGYFRLELGLRFAFPAARGGDRPRTPDGRLLLRFGVEGDLEYYVTEAGDVWTRDIIADRVPHRWAPDPLSFAREFRWPNAADLEPLAAVTVVQA